MTAALLSSIANRGVFGYKTFSTSTSGSGTRLDLSSFVGSASTPAGARVFFVTINSGVACWGQGYSSSGIYTGLSFAGSTFVAGDVIVITNNGFITGAGGAGSTGNGENGYTALDLSALPAGVVVQVINNGMIAGGGGGGGGASINSVYGGSGAGAGGIAYDGTPGASTWDSVGVTSGLTSPPVGGGGGTKPDGTGGAGVSRTLSSPSDFARMIGVGGGTGGSGGGYIISGTSGTISATTGAGGNGGGAGFVGVVSLTGNANYYLGGGGGGWGAAGANGIASAGAVGTGGAAGRAISTTSATVLLTNNGVIYGAY